MTRKKYDIDDTMEGKWKECEFDGDIEFIIEKNQIKVQEDKDEKDELYEKYKKEDRIIEKIENIYFELYEYGIQYDLGLCNNMRLDKWMNINQKYLKFKIQ